MRIAHVGASKPKTQEDTCRWVVVLSRLAKRDGFPNGVREDTINLEYGRDFLAERKRYDGVIVHSVFNPKVRARKTQKFPRLRISPLHSLKAWRSRLVSTNALWIAVCEGQPLTLNGWELGTLPGYAIADQDHLVTLYRRVK